MPRCTDTTKEYKMNMGQHTELVKKSPAIQGSVMGAARDLKQEDQYFEVTGRDAIAILEKRLNVRVTMIAALLGVSERTLTNWTAYTITQTSVPSKFRRLQCLYRCVEEIYSQGINDGDILNVLNEPVGDEGDLSLLDHIVDNPENKLLSTVIKTVVSKFK
jgi:DNA-binding transcriptional regulator YiaG